MEKSSSKIISAENGESIIQWSPPEMGQTAGRGKISGGKLPTADQLEALQKQAYKEGFERGKREGFAYGHKEALASGKQQLEQQTQKMDHLLYMLDKPLSELDDEVERDLVNMVIAIVRQLIRREVRTDPGHIAGVVREALAILPVASRNMRLVLHPDDAKLIRDVYDVSGSKLGWEIQEDPVLARGGCKVLTETSQVDATLESRLATLAASLLGGDRTDDGNTIQPGGADGV
ncbi:MAG: flagellar assembly protein FliH [Gammaproteobacteria bacterium]|nr:flagellar assembly protein FliH [Gammaproteobacteria bacterium]